jgi:23S rRNA pseudouridine2605 synthase
VRGADDLRPRRAPRRVGAFPPGRVTLARALSKFGVTSRADARRLVASGRVRVDGKGVSNPDLWIDPVRDLVTVDGRIVSDSTERVVIAFHKPVGLVTTRTDPGGRPTVYDRLGDVGRWVFPVGRLDRDTSGLLVFTNDHHLGHRLTVPEAHVPKTYHARVEGIPDATALRLLREGVPIGRGETTRPAEVRVLGAARGGSTWLEIVLTEGKNRQVRRMGRAVGHDVLELVRVAIGGLALGDLRPGEWRRLDAEEIARLTRGA